MSELTGCAVHCLHDDVYCDNCDQLVGLAGVHVVGVDRRPDGLVVEVESSSTVMGCPTCGVVARSHGRRTISLVDIPCFGAVTRLRWRKRTCPEPSCPVGVFTEQDELGEVLLALTREEHVTLDEAIAWSGARLTRRQAFRMRAAAESGHGEAARTDPTACGRIGPMPCPPRPTR